jgi:hypothetical protein
MYEFKFGALKIFVLIYEGNRNDPLYHLSCSSSVPFLQNILQLMMMIY